MFPSEGQLQSRRANGQLPEQPYPLLCTSLLRLRLTVARDIIRLFCGSEVAFTAVCMALFISGTMGDRWCLHTVIKTQQQGQIV